MHRSNYKVRCGIDARWCPPREGWDSLRISQQTRRDENGGFADEPLIEQAAEEPRPSLHKQGVDVVCSHQGHEGLGQVDARAAGRPLNDVHPSVPEGVHRAAIGGRSDDGDERRVVDRPNQCSVEREAGPWVDDDPRGDSPRTDMSGGELRVVCKNGTDAGQDSVYPATLAVYEASALLARNPPAVAASRRDAAVDGLRPLGCDPGKARLKRSQKRLGDQLAGVRFDEARIDAQPPQDRAASARPRVGIAAAVDDPRWGRRGQGMDTGRRAAVVGAGLK